MEVFIRDEYMKYAVVDKSQFEPYSFLLESYDKIKVKSIDQHDAEVRAEERKKVVAELQEWNDKLIDEGYIIDYEDLEQKLNELKGE